MCQDSCSRFVIDHLAPEMTDGYVCFLNARRATLKGQRHKSHSDPSGSELLLSRRSSCSPVPLPVPPHFQHVLRFPLVLIAINTSPALRQSCNLTRKDLFVTKIVADCRQCGRVCGQRDRRPRTSLFFVTANQLGRDVLRICGAAAVAAEQNLFSGVSASQII
jgi:hypothetical protein